MAWRKNLEKIAETIKNRTSQVFQILLRNGECYTALKHVLQMENYVELTIVFAGKSAGTAQITLAWTMSRKKCIIVCVSAICLIVVVAAGVSAGGTLIISLIQPGAVINRLQHQRLSKSVL